LYITRLSAVYSHYKVGLNSENLISIRKGNSQDQKDLFHLTNVPLIYGHTYQE